MLYWYGQASPAFPVLPETPRLTTSSILLGSSEMSHSGLRAALLALLLAGTMLLLAYLQSGPSDQSGTAVSPEAAAALSAPVSPAPKPASESTPVPSSEPASEPAPEPTSKPAPEPTPDLPQELPESWFDDALFLGDSLTGSLSTYILRNGGLGNASFVYVNGLGCHHITRDGTMIPIMGLCLPIEEAVEISGCGKLFLMLAMNDVGTEPIDELRASWETVLDRILERNPAVKVYVQSGTPILQKSHNEVS